MRLLVHKSLLDTETAVRMGGGLHMRGAGSQLF